METCATSTKPERLFHQIEDWISLHAKKVPYMICTGLKSRTDKAALIRILRRMGLKRDSEGTLRIREYFPQESFMTNRYYHEFYVHIGCRKLQKPKTCLGQRFSECVPIGLYKGY